MKYIQKKIISEMPKTVGSISDTLNVEDKQRNAPSINLVGQMAGVPTDGVIEFRGDEIPEGYEEVKVDDLLATSEKDGLMSAEDKTKLDNLDGESYVNISSQIVKTGVISDLEIYHAYAKKKNGFTSLKIILRTNTGWPTSDISDVITLPDIYKSSAPVVSFCRMHNNYNYPSWNGTNGEFIGFLYMGSKSINIRTKQTGMKVAVIDLVY